MKDWKDEIILDIYNQEVKPEYRAVFINKIIRRIETLLSQQRKEILEEQKESAKEALKWLRKLVKDKKALEEINTFIKPLTK